MGTRSKMKAAFFLLSALVATSLAVPKSRNELTCSICIDIITDLDNFITSDTTEDQIVQFAKELCHALGSLLGASLEEQQRADGVPAARHHRRLGQRQLEPSTGLHQHRRLPLNIVQCSMNIPLNIGGAHLMRTCLHKHHVSA